MGCLYHVGKYFVVYLVVFVALIFFMGAISVDFIAIAQGKEPYFFDPDYIEAYNESIFEGVEDKLVSNYDKYIDAIKSAEREMAFLPNNDKLEIEFLEGSEVNLSVRYKGGYKFTTPFDYKATENQAFMLEIGLTADKLDKLKRKIEAANCISFRKENGLKLGFTNEKKGTYYYRFKSSSKEDINMLLDSCLIKNLNNHVLLEYIGTGRGPGCIKSQNPEGYDDRSFVKKWIDLITSGGAAAFDKPSVLTNQ